MKSLNKTYVVFDYDGTLHDCIKIYYPAFQKTYRYLVSLSVVKEKVWAEKEVARWLGLNQYEMWHQFMPAISSTLRDNCSHMIGEEMLSAIYSNSARLYEHTLATLDWLKQRGYVMLLLSNCKRAYMEAHREMFQLDKYFEGYYCAEAFNYQSKVEIFRHIYEKYQGNFIMVGDRYQDIEVGLRYPVETIGCKYGYGESWELAEARHVICDSSEIISTVQRIARVI